MLNGKWKLRRIARNNQTIGANLLDSVAGRAPCKRTLLNGQFVKWLSVCGSDAFQFPNARHMAVH